MNQKYKTLDDFLNHLEMDEDLALADVTTKDRNKKGVTYRKCPRCGSTNWKILNTNDFGRAESCNKCEDKQQ